MNVVAFKGRTEVAGAEIAGSLPALVQKAARQLAEATTAAEVLEAKAAANLAYDAAKAAARFAKAKGAYDDVIGAVYRAQADALEIEAAAKRRLADEYDAAQERGEVVSQSGGGAVRWGREGIRVSDENTKLTQSEIGVTRTEIFRAREARDIEASSPGITGLVARELADAGIEPTKAAVSREINTRLNSFSGDNEWYTPAKYIELAREVLGEIELDPASSLKAQETVKASRYYTKQQDGISKEWSGRVWLNPPYSQPDIQNFADKALSEIQSGRVPEAVILTNSASDTTWFHALAARADAVCFPRGRIKFESPTRTSNSPAMGQAFFYFGSDRERFFYVFRDIGIILVKPNE